MPDGSTKKSIINPFAEENIELPPMPSRKYGVSSGGALFNDALAMARRPDGKPIQDFSGMTKIVIVAGFGGAGKTTWIVTMGGHLLANDVSMGMAALDENGRWALADRMQGVVKPKTKIDPHTGEEVVVEDADRALERFSGTAEQHKISLIADLGANSTAIQQIHARRPRFVQEMRDKGVEVILVLPMGPSTRDLHVLADLQGRGFKPSATLIVENYGLLQPRQGVDGFGLIRGEPPYQQAVAEGAVVVGMPRLDHEVLAWQERTKATLTEARDRVGNGVKLPLHVSSTAASYLKRFTDWHDPVASWMPGR